MATTPSAPSRIEDFFRRGDDAVRREDYSLAKSEYSGALEIDPTRLDAQAGLDYVRYLEGGRKSRYEWKPGTISAEAKERRDRNLELYEEEFAKKKTRLKSLPPKFLLEHTTRCNFYCPHCSKGYDPYYTEDMSEEVADAALDVLLPTATWGCITGFGEPTIGNRYGHLMKRMAENEVVPHYSTNVSTLTIPHIEGLIQAEAQIILSIDGASRETFETIRAGGDWDRVLGSLAAIRRLRAILGGKSIFGITFVVMRTNVHELCETVRLVHRFGLDFLKVQDYQAFGEKYDENTLRNDPETGNRAFCEAEELAEELEVDLILPPRYEVAELNAASNEVEERAASWRLFPKRKRFPQRCYLPWQFTQIGIRGEVMPCCYSTRVLGMLKDTPFEKIWNGFEYRLFRWRIETFFPPIECRECHVYEGINKGNAGNTMAGEGLLVKWAYRFEEWYNRKRNERKFPAEADPREPNYYQGKTYRPIETVDDE